MLISSFAVTTPMPERHVPIVRTFSPASPELNNLTVESRADPASAWIPSNAPRAIVVDLLAGAVFKLVAEGRALDARDLGGGAAETIP